MSTDSEQEEVSGRTLELESAGLTMLGIFLSIGVTVALGIRADWWLRVCTGLGAVALLVVLFGYVVRPGQGPVARLARWLTRT